MSNKDFGSTEGSPVVKIAALVIISAGVIYARSIIIPFLLALFISIICAQPVSWLAKKRIPRWLALTIVLLTMIIIFSGFAFMIGGTLSSFSNNLPKYGSTLTTISNSFIQFLNMKGLNIPEHQVLNLIEPARVLKFVASALNELFSMMGNTFLIFLIVLFMLMEFEIFSDKVRAIMFVSNESITHFSTILHHIRHYLKIKTLMCLLVGIVTYVAFLIIGVDFPLIWALLAGLLNYIPNIGSIIAAIPTVLFALIQLGTGGALWTLGTFLLIHAVFGNFVEPRIMGKGLGLSTLVVFLSLLFWGFILGTVGMFLSVPITITIKIFLEQNEKTQWLAILLGTAAEAKIYLKHKERIKEVQDEKSPLKDRG
jgi:AI-2 transport protein TqsA